MARFLVIFTLFGAPVMAAEPINLLNTVYSSPGGVDLKLDFVRPAGDGPFPLVVCVHGGGWRAGSHTEYKDFQKHMAALGYATASVQYRFAPKHTFPAPLDDVNNAIKFLVDGREKYRVDPARVGLLGGSAGGHLSLLAGLPEHKDWKVLAIVNVAGPTDLRVFQSTKAGDAALKGAVTRDSSELLADLLGTPDRKADVYATASPVTLVRKGGPAVLTLHGDADDIVPISQAELLHAALKKVGVDETLMRIPGGGHSLGEWPAKERTAAILATIALFKKHLNPADVK